MSTNQSDPKEKFYTPTQLHKMLHIPKRTLRYMVRVGRFPRPVVFEGRTVRFRESEIKQWLEGRLAGAVPGASGSDIQDLAHTHALIYLRPDRGSSAEI